VWIGASSGGKIEGAIDRGINPFVEFLSDWVDRGTPDVPSIGIDGWGASVSIESGVLRFSETTATCPGLLIEGRDLLFLCRKAQDNRKNPHD
jgi:hypothetical protein